MAARKSTAKDKDDHEVSPGRHDDINFEQSLAELELLVEKMEQGELPLEQALQQFERGIELARGCQSALRQAEQKVELLLEKNGQTDIVPFDKPGISKNDE
jgi:exodeoxyribonuclease VII small subunit